MPLGGPESVHECRLQMGFPFGEKFSYSLTPLEKSNYILTDTSSVLLDDSFFLII